MVNSKNVKHTSFFILEWIDVDFELPHQINENIIFRKATSIEINHLDTYFKNNIEDNTYFKFYKNTPDSINHSKDLYNQGHSRVAKGSRLTNPKEWRYFIIDINRKIIDDTILQFALNIQEFELNLGVKLIPWNTPDGIMGFRHPGKIFQFTSNMDRINITNLNQQYFRNALNYYTLINSSKKNFPFIYKSLCKYEELKEVSDKSLLKVLGYFIIIEILLTHNPKDPTNIDSITRQLSNKVTLLENRNIDTLNILQWFENTNYKKLFEILYAYRSAIAHGSSIDFNNKFQILKNEYYVFRFIQYLCKSTLRIALKEPQLIKDLKNC